MIYILIYNFWPLSRFGIKIVNWICLRRNLFSGITTIFIFFFFLIGILKHIYLIYFILIKIIIVNLKYKNYKNNNKAVLYY